MPDFDTRPIGPVPAMVCGRDAGQRLARGDDARAVRADHPGVGRVGGALQVGPHLGGVLHRHALGDDHEQADAGVDGLDAGVLGERRRHEDDRHVGAGLLHRLRDACRRPAAPCRRARRVVPALRALTPPTMLAPDSTMSGGVLGAHPARHALDDDLGVLVQVDRHLFCFSVSGVGQLGGLVGRAVHRVDHGSPAGGWLVEDATALLDVVAVEAHDQRLGGLVAEDLQRTDDAVGDLVAGGDAAEDVDEDALDLLRR